MKIPGKTGNFHGLEIQLNIKNTVVNKNLSKFAQELKSTVKIEIKEKFVEKRIA